MFNWERCAPHRATRWSSPHLPANKPLALRAHTISRNNNVRLVTLPIISLAASTARFLVIKVVYNFAIELDFHTETFNLIDKHLVHEWPHLELARRSVWI